MLLATDYALHFKESWIPFVISLLETIPRVFRLNKFFDLTFTCIQINEVYSFAKFLLLNNL